MNSSLATRLLDLLKERVPVDTGQLKSSIQMVQLSEKEWVVVIGSDASNIRGVPSNTYASKTNFDKTVGKNNRPNRNYHWVNKAVKQWARENMIQLELESDDEDNEDE